MLSGARPLFLKGWRERHEHAPRYFGNKVAKELSSKRPPGLSSFVNLGCALRRASNNRLSRVAAAWDGGNKWRRGKLKSENIKSSG